MFNGHNLKAPTWPKQSPGKTLLAAMGAEGKEEEKEMSTALWCDKGEHAFSRNDVNRQHFTQTQTVETPTGNSYGRTTYQERQEVTSEMDICGPCWRKSNLFEPNQDTPKALDESELDAAKAEADMWRAKYEAHKDSWGPQHNAD